MPSLGNDVFDACHLTGSFILRSGQTSAEYFDKYLFEGQPELLRRVPHRDLHGVQEPDWADPGERLNAATDADPVKRTGTHARSEHPLALPCPVGDASPRLLHGGIDIDGEL